MAASSAQNGGSGHGSSFANRFTPPLEQIEESKEMSNPTPTLPPSNLHNSQSVFSTVGEQTERGMGDKVQSVMTFPPSKVTSFSWKDITFYYPQKKSGNVFAKKPKTELPVTNAKAKPAIDRVR